MWGATVRAVTSVVGGFFVALIVERFLGVLLDLANGAPDSSGSPIIGALTTAHENFYLLVLLGIVVAYLARAHVEAKMVSPR